MVLLVQLCLALVVYWPVFYKEAVFSVWQHTYTALLVVLFGLFGVLLAQSSFFLSVYYGDSATATVFLSLGPAIIVVLMSIYSKRWPYFSIWFGGVYLDPKTAVTSNATFSDCGLGIINRWTGR
ncbi:hypothetical protein BMS78_10100 [Leuconostoc pseudomesenteroides]|nr:hypothetical protein BMS78_10100 [Leuconostoc pseudomesenteroides]